MEELTKEADAKVKLLKYTRAKTRGVVEKGNLGAVERQRENLKELVKEIGALKLRVEPTMFEAGKAQKRLRIGAVASKNLSLKLMEKFQA